MRLSRLALIPVVALVAACSSGGGASPAASAAAPSAEAPTRIDVALTDALEILPEAMTLPAGVPVTFVVTNQGATVHEFVIGDEDVQAEHEAEMEAGSGMGHDEPNAVTVDPGESKELVFTFDAAGETLAGCHLPGHYDGGMKATITVTG